MLRLVGANDDLGRVQLVGHDLEDLPSVGSAAAGRVRGLLLRTAACGGDAHRITVAVVTRPKTERGADLLEVVDAVDALGLFLRRGERRQQETREDRDDRDHDQELDQGESSDFERTCMLHFNVSRAATSG